VFQDTRSLFYKAYRCIGVMQMYAWRTTGLIMVCLDLNVLSFLNKESSFVGRSYNDMSTHKHIGMSSAKSEETNCIVKMHGFVCVYEGVY
jgi:hypothetical protein